MVAKDTGLRTAPPDQPRLHHGRADLPRAAVHHRCRGQHLADLEAKVDIVQNAIDLALGPGHGEPPRVAILSAVETVNSEDPDHVEAAALCKMADRGQITGGAVDGPLALDNAISPEAAQIKGIKSPVAGRANILVVPDLEAGNMLAKNLSFLANADAAGIVLGARVPIILTSRADSVRTRMASCAVAALYAHAPARAAAARRRSRPDGRDHPGRQCRLVEHQVPAVRDRLAADRLELAAQGPDRGHRHAPAPRRQGRGRPRAGRRRLRAGSGRGRARGAGSARATGCWPSSAGRGRRRRPPRRAWRAELQRAGADRRRGPRRARAPGAAGAAAPAQQSGADPGHPRALPGDPAGRLLRHRLPPRPPRGRRSLRDPGRATTRRACAATASTACPTSTSRSRLPEIAPALAEGRVVVAISAAAPRCARSRPAAASTARWASPPSTACRWARAPASSTRASCST